MKKLVSKRKTITIKGKKGEKDKKITKHVEEYVDMSQEEIDDYNSRQPTSDDLLKSAKDSAIYNRKAYLKSESSWYYESDTLPKKIKDKRILARKEIEQIKKEADIDNIIIEFN